MQNYDKVTTATLEYDVTVVKYTLNGDFHRTDGPAMIGYHPDGTVKSEVYCLKGQLHREDGPASICYHFDGTIENAKYYLHGIPIEDF